MRDQPVIIRADTALVLETCYTCGIPFGLPVEYQRRLLEEARQTTFYCPNGHGQCYVGRTATEKLADAKDENLSLRQRLDQAEADAARKGKQLTSLKKRVNAGLCPHCNRHFTNLERHIAGKHQRQDREAEGVG